MVATLVRLRFALLANSLKRSPWQIVAVVLGGLYGLGILGLAVVGLVALSFAPLELARTVTVLGGAALILGWIVLPLLTSGIDQTVEPSRLATFPIPINTLLLGLLVSGVLGVPGIVTTVAALATVGTWWRYPFAACAAVLCALLAVLTAVVGSRMLAALVTRIGSGRRAREARTVLLIVPLVLLGPIILGFSALLRDVAFVLPDIATVVSWTPFGASWAVPAAIAAGDYGGAALKFGIALASLGVFLLLWRWGLGRALETPAHSSTVTASTRGIGLFGVFPASPAGAVTARALTYWIRDPRYAQSLISIPLIPALIFFYSGLNGNLGPLVLVGPIVALLLAMSIYTDVSYDNTAFALHLKTGVSGVADRVGRVAALAVFAVPVSLILTIASVAVTNSWSMLPGLLGIVIGVLLTGFGVSSIVSGALTFPVPAPGESPFKARPGGGFSLMLSSFATWAVLGVLALPEVILAVLSFVWDSTLLGWISVLVGLVLGGVLLVVGVRLGGAILDRRGPELLAQLQKQK